MAYIILGVVSVIALLGGGKKVFREFGGKSIVIVIFLAAVMIGNIIPPINIAGGFYLSIGGSLLLIYAFISAFYHNKFINQLYIFYISALLGFSFYFFGKMALNIYGGLFENIDKLFFGIVALTICLFSGNAKNAFSISIISIVIADLIYALQVNAPVYILGGEGSFNAIVIITALAYIGQLLIKIVSTRLYPSRKEMLFEASDELFPDEDDEDIK